MSSRCTICAHADLKAISDLLAGGARKKDVAKQFGISVFALSRHVRHTPENEVSKWLKRADDQYLLATASADSRGAVNALVAGLRAVETRVREEERAAEAEAEAEQLKEDDALTVQDLDRIVAKFSKVEAAAIDRTNRVAVTESQRMRWFDLADLFFACASDADLRQALLDFGQERITATKEKNESVSQIHVTN